MATTVQEKLAASQRKADEITKLQRKINEYNRVILNLRNEIEVFCPEILEFQKQQQKEALAFFNSAIEKRQKALEAMFV